MSEWLTLAEAAKRLGISLHRVRTLALEGEVDTQEVAGELLVHVPEGLKIGRTWQGKTDREWAAELALPLKTVRSRIRRHGDPRKTDLPRVEWQGKSVREWAAGLGISINAARKRIARLRSAEERG